MFTVSIDGAGLDKDGWTDGFNDSGAFVDACVGPCVGLGDEGDSLL